MVVENLSKEFRVLRHRSGLAGSLRSLVSREGKTVKAIDDVSFAIERGEFVGYVGPNGAGKSTTIKALAGILVPTSGKVEVCGLVPHRKRTLNARQIGVVFGQRTQLWWDLPPLDGFRLLGRIYRIDRADVEERIDAFTSLLDLEPLLETPVRKLSLGEKMRCELVAALLHDPPILFLDEPTIGLDVVAKQQIRSFLLQINRERSTTVLLTSHDLDDIERLCGRVMVIDHGSILHDGTVDSLKRVFGNHRRLSFELAAETEMPYREHTHGESNSARPDLDSAHRSTAPDLEMAHHLAIPAIELPPGAAVETFRDRQLMVRFDADRVRAPEVVRAVMERVEVLDFQLQEIEIEDVVRRIYQRDSDAS